MRKELAVGFFLNSLSFGIGRFMIFPDAISNFLSGVFMGLGIVMVVVSLLPEKIYNNLYYRKLLDGRIK